MRYLVLVKSRIMLFMAYRFDFIFSFATNIFYVILFYYLWKAIYDSRGEINGMTFSDTFIYLALSQVVFYVVETSINNELIHKIQSGDLIIDFIKPLNYLRKLFFENVGIGLGNFLFISLPMFIVILLFFNTKINLGINLLFFAISFIMSFIIYFLISFLFGLLGFYTQSAWGIAVSKSIITMLLSGVMIPLNFFPAILRNITFCLPFHTIIDTPIMLLISRQLNSPAIISYLWQQFLWIGILFISSSIFYKKMINYLTVNGG